jgi:hypothetical protein
MSSHESASGTPLTTLIAYWLGELDRAQEVALEEHLFDCGECHARLRALVELGQGVKQAMRAGRMGAVLTPVFVAQLQQSGLRLREYRLQPGENVYCTVTPQDDLVVAHLQAPLGGIQRLDLQFYDETAGTSWRIEDVPFVPNSAGIALASNTQALRKLSFATQRVELLAVEGATQRIVATYTFNHSPHRAGAPTE